MKSETKLKVGLGLVFCLFLGGGMYVIKGMVKDLNARDITRFMAEPAASYELRKTPSKRRLNAINRALDRPVSLLVLTLLRYSLFLMDCPPRRIPSGFLRFFAAIR